MARDKLPPYVQRRVRRDGSVRFRAWCVLEGTRRYARARTTAEAAYRDALRMRQLGDQLPPNRLPTLGDAMAAVEKHCRLKRTAGTLAWYRQQWVPLKAELGEATPLEVISRDQVEAFVERRLAKVSASTVRHHLRALGRCFNVGRRAGWCLANPVEQIELPRVDEPALHWFTRAQLIELLGQVDDPVARDLLVLFAYTGVRRAEAGRLRPDDVHLQAGELVVRGKRRTRVVPIDGDLAPVLARWLERSTPEQLIPGGVPWIVRTFQAWQKRLREPRLHPHALRHTFATLLVQAGERLDVVQHLLGHRTLTMVLRYVHGHGPEARRAVGRLRLLPAAEQGEVGES